MRATLANWIESQVDAPISGIDPLLVEASNRQFYRVWLAVSRPDQGALAVSDPNANSSISSTTESKTHLRGTFGYRAAGHRSKSATAESWMRNQETLVVMDSPPALERNEAFVAVQQLLSGHGLPVPPLLAMDATQGFFLLGDLGDRHIEDIYGTPVEEAAVASAIDNLAVLQRIEASDIPPYLASRFRDELGIFVEWLLGNLLDEPLPSSAADAFEKLIDNAIDQPQCLIHRDYHCRNLLLSPSGELGIVDFQDALIGPATYDLACLLWDCYHEFSDAQRRRWQRHYDSVSPFSFKAGELSRALDLIGLQRQLKAIGIFARLKLRDGKPSHLRYIGPVLNAATRLCADYQETRQLGNFLAKLEPQLSKALGTLQTDENSDNPL